MHNDMFKVSLFTFLLFDFPIWDNQLLNTLVICPKALQSLYITDCIYPCTYKSLKAVSVVLY